MGKETRNSSREDREIRFPVRYYNRRGVLFDDPVPARGYKGHTEKPLAVRASETVVGVMHASNAGYPGGLEWSADSPPPAACCSATQAAFARWDDWAIAAWF